MAEGASLRVMVDTTVLIAGSGWPRWPHEVLLAGLRGEFQLVLCPYALEQAHRKLRERFPEHLKRFEESLSQAHLEIVADPSAAELEQHKGLIRDETDVPIVLAAINAGVDYLISEDKDLTAQDATTAELRQHLRILLPGIFLREVMGWSGDQLERLRGGAWKDVEKSR